MSKDKISDYSTTANSNTDIGGINVDEGCAPSGINDAIRTLMAQLKTWQSGGQDVYIHPAGSASAPSITANGDTNTGIFFPAADTVAISTGGSERARVDSSGNIGLGVTPSAWATSQSVRAMQIGPSGVGSFWNYSNYAAFIGCGYYWNGTNRIYLTTGNAVSEYSQNSGVHSWLTAASGTAGNAITFTQAMTLDASGNWFLGGTTTSTSTGGIGRSASVISTSSGNSVFTIESTGTTANANYAIIDFVNRSQASGDTRYAEIFSSRSSTSTSALDGFIGFSTATAGSTTEKARIDSSGALLVGTTSNPSSFRGVFKASSGYESIAIQGQSSGQGGGIFFRNGSGGANQFSTQVDSNYYYIFDADGSHYAYYPQNGTSWSFASDRRIKRDIVDINYGLNAVMAIQPRRFTYAASGKNDIGFIAQELRDVVPEAVTGVEQEFVDGETQIERAAKTLGVAKDALIPVLVKAIQELKAIVDAQAAEIAALKG